jgi:predicted regulator of Ras-like GTPase activity (Roadblock/LC7/MglB family)
MNERVDQILRELASQSLAIEGAILVSSEGQPITTAMGIQSNSAIIMAGTMLRLAEQVCEEFKWQEIEQVSIRAPEGYLTLIRCNEDVFLLVKTAKVPWGGLDRGIHRTIKILQTELQTIEVPKLKPDESSQLTRLLKNNQITVINQAHPQKSQLNSDFIGHSQQELAKYIGPIASVVCKRILCENPELGKVEFIETLAKYIPQQQQALEFQRNLLS